MFSIAYIYILAAILLLILFYYIIGIRAIANDKIAIVEKWWSTKGSLKDNIIALNGEAGFQPNVLRGGIHFKSPLIYKIHKMPLITIPQGKIGYVFARDGEPLSPTQTLGKVVEECSNFQDVTAFIKNGGQRGPQRGILREGTYAFNLAQFIIITENKVYYLSMGDKRENLYIESMIGQIQANNGFIPVIINNKEDVIGIVTVNDGPSLPQDTIIAPTIGDDVNDKNYHNNFQDIEKFLKAGGRRGRQHQVLVEGTYFINRIFATVEYIKKTIIDIGYVGVVNSYVGLKGKDTSGDSYKHGELVDIGCKGIWKTPLLPGKYAFNTYSGHVFQVPTTNVILKWIASQAGSHKFDENLSEVSIITKDAFEPSLPLSIVFHIDYKKAPYVIQRFGDVKKLVEQTLDPMVSAYFKNIGQTKTLIELIQNRSEIQNLSSNNMREKFEHYDLELEEVLIGTPTASKNDDKIQVILEQLRGRQVAEEQIETFSKQQKASEKRRELNEAQAKAEQQASLTQSNINIGIQENVGKGELARALQEAQRIQKIAEAEAYKVKQEAEAAAYKIEKEATAEATKVRVMGEAESDKVTRVGIASAIASKEQVKALGGAQLKIIQDTMMEFANAIKEAKIPLVPSTLITTGKDSAVEIPNALMSIFTVLLGEKLSKFDSLKEEIPSPEVEKIKNEILAKIKS